MLQVVLMRLDVQRTSMKMVAAVVPVRAKDAKEHVSFLYNRPLKGGRLF